jgi:hypothetical protein
LGERERVLRPGSRIVVAGINVSGAQNVHGSQSIEHLIGGQVDFAVTLSVNFLDDVLGVSFGVSRELKLWFLSSRGLPNPAASHKSRSTSHNEPVWRVKAGPSFVCDVSSAAKLARSWTVTPMNQNRNRALRRSH